MVWLAIQPSRRWRPGCRPGYTPECYVDRPPTASTDRSRSRTPACTSAPPVRAGVLAYRRRHLVHPVVAHTRSVGGVRRRRDDAKCQGRTQPCRTYKPCPSSHAAALEPGQGRLVSCSHQNSALLRPRRVLGNVGDDPWRPRCRDLDSRVLLAPVRAYAATDPATLGATVDRYLGELATGLWMAADVSAQRTRVV